MFGSISPTQAEDVAAEFVNSDLLIIDGGRCDIGIESTVLLVEKDCLTILRRGQVNEEMLVATLPTNALDYIRVETRALSSSGLQTKAVSSPGQFLRHYSPRTECYLVMKGGPMLPGAVRAILPARLDGFVVILDCNPALAELEPDALRSLAGLLPEGTEPARILRAYSVPTLEAAAQSLFETLRRADKLGPACILALPPEPAGGLPTRSSTGSSGRQAAAGSSKRGAPGVEPGTSPTRTENHTARPCSCSPPNKARYASPPFLVGCQ